MQSKFDEIELHVEAILCELDDIPYMFVCNDNEDNKYLIMSIDADVFKYSIIKIDKNTLIDIINGEYTMYDALKNSNNGIFVSYCVDFLEWTEIIDSNAFSKYLEDAGWKQFKYNREDIKIYQLENNDDFYQVTIPIDKRLNDYKTAMHKAVKTVSEAQNKPIERIIIGLLNIDIPLLKIEQNGAYTPYIAVPVSFNELSKNELPVKDALFEIPNKSVEKYLKELDGGK